PVLNQTTRKVALPSLLIQRGQATKKLFVRNIPFVCRKSELHQLFSPYGPVHDIIYPTDKFGRYKGFAFITLDEAKAEDAIVMLCGKPIEDKLLKVSHAIDKFSKPAEA
ncbi:hypothetical protein L0F63_005608, partial [Massospora cicadina]